MASGMDALAAMLGQLVPRDRPARCPKCGGRLTATVTIYATVPVVVREWGSGERRALYGTRFAETKRALEEQAAEEYGQVDERDDIYCENYAVGGGCDYHTHATALEFPEAQQ